MVQPADFAAGTVMEKGPSVAGTPPLERNTRRGYRLNLVFFIFVIATLGTRNRNSTFTPTWSLKTGLHKKPFVPGNTT